jgi:probable F420-dependent oxidoreductase
MEFWLPIIHEPENQIVEIARIAEAVGVRGIALADHIAVPVALSTVHPSGESRFNYHDTWIDPLVTAATIAATTGMEVLSYVYVLSMREPLTVAKQVAGLSTLSGGRFKFGVGTGWLREEIELFGYDPRVRGRRVDEMLEIMRGFWREGVFEFHGEFFDLEPTAMFPVPSPIPSVWVGGESDQALARAARSDGWIGMTYDMDDMWALLDRVLNTRAAAGPPADAPFEVMITPNAPPSRELYDEMESRGVTSTLMMPWYPGHPDWTDLDKKRRALEQFSEAYIHN